MAEEGIFDVMAQKLLEDYASLFYVNAATDEYVWFAKDAEAKKFVKAGESAGFYDYVEGNAVKLIHEEDRDMVAEYLRYDNLVKTVGVGQTKEVKFRYVGGGAPEYYTMRVIRLEDNDKGEAVFVIALGNINDDERRHRVVQKLKEEREVYNQIAKSLACEYESIYYVDIETGKYSEFSPNEYYESMKVPKNWEDFYQDTRENAKLYAHPDDRDFAVSIYDKDKIKEILHKKKSFSYKYRIMVAGVPRYFLFTMMRANEGRSFVLCVKDVEDELEAERIRLESQRKSISFTKIAESLASNYDVIYYVNIEDSSYVGYTSKNIYGQMEVQEEGEDFFHDSAENTPMIIHPDDQERILSVLTRDYLLSSLEVNRHFEIDYRMVIKDETQHARITVRKSSDAEHFIIGVENIDEVVRKEKEHLTALNNERELARRDGLTGVKNKIAYNELIKSVQNNIDNGVDYLPFAIAVCDLNYLKKTNDTFGHKAGDDLLRAGCKIICDVFDHSPVFRIGGDEFAVFIRGDDYANISELEKNFKEQVLKNNESGEGPVIAIGIALFVQGRDVKVTEVFDRADSLMYENKRELKEGH